MSILTIWKDMDKYESLKISAIFVLYQSFERVLVMFVIKIYKITFEFQSHTFFVVFTLFWDFGIFYIKAHLFFFNFQNF